MRLQEKLRSSSHYKWVLVGILFCIATLNYADRSVLSSLFPLLTKDLGMSDLGLAGIGTVFLWSYAIASPFAGVIGDRAPRRLVIAVCLGAWSLVMVATSFAHSSGQLLTMRCLLGLFEALFFPASYALISEFHDHRSRGLAIAILVSGMSFGAVAGGTYGGYVGENYGWRTAVLGLGVVGVALALLTPAFVLSRAVSKDAAGDQPPARTTTKRAVWSEVVMVLSLPLSLIMIGQSTLISIGTLIFSNWLPLYFSQTYHLSLATAGFAGTAALNIGGIIGVLVGGWLSDVAARRGVLYRMVLQSAFYFSTIPFLVMFMRSNQLNVVAFGIFAFSVLRTIGQASEVPILCDNLPDDLRATATGMLNAANCFAGGLGILVSAYFKETAGLKLVFFTSSLLIAVSGILLLAGYVLLRRAARAREAGSVAGAAGPGGN